uniref:Uncharacterized protein n=1 Tax=Oryza sativa subsp. japonica TaxID=39947 RepID=Q53KS1_ORYSJ|nr:hypothetical protein LOC_Os11g13460 [Oryza sativa Japonica Group]
MKKSSRAGDASAMKAQSLSMQLASHRTSRSEQPKALHPALGAVGCRRSYVLRGCLSDDEDEEDDDDDDGSLGSGVRLRGRRPGSRESYRRLPLLSRPDLRRRRHYGGVLDQYRPAPAVRDRHDRGGCGSYHGLGLRSNGLLVLPYRDVAKRRDVGNGSRCLVRVASLGGYSGDRGDCRCREVGGGSMRRFPLFRVFAISITSWWLFRVRHSSGLFKRVAEVGH